MLELILELSGIMLALFVSINIKSAFFPTSIDPISSSRPRAFAPLIVPIAIASSEVRTFGSRVETF